MVVRNSDVHLTRFLNIGSKKWHSRSIYHFAFTLWLSRIHGLQGKIFAFYNLLALYTY
jgi:hypothetical protein